MKIKNKKYLLVNILLFLTIVLMPLYSLRVNLESFSISLLSINLLILSIVLFTLNYKNLKITFLKNYLVWLFSALFIISFIPTLLLNTTTHGVGVFIEWLFLPVLTSFLIFTHVTKNPLSLIWLKNALVSALFFTSTISLIYLIFDQLTFDGRLTSFYLSPNHLAMFIAPLILIAAANAFTACVKTVKNFSIITILLALLVLFFTNSFSSIFALLLSLFFISFFIIKRKFLLMLLGFLFILLVCFFGYHKLSNINQDLSKSSLMSRSEIWLVSTNHIQQNIFIPKNGIDEFQQIYLDAQPMYTPYLHWSAPTPHNLIFTLWISGGFLTILFFCLICSRTIFEGLKNYYKTKNTAVLLYVAAFLTIILTGLFDTPYWKNDLSFIFWLLLITSLKK